MEPSSLSASPSPHIRQRKLLRSVLSRFGSKHSFMSNSSTQSAGSSPNGGKDASDLKSLAHGIANGNSFDIDEDLDFDAEGLFKVISNDDMFSVERCQPPAPRSIESEELGHRASSAGSGGDDCGDDDDEVFGFEEMLRMHRQQVAEEPAAERTALSPSSSSRRMIKSLPRVFKVSMRSSQDIPEGSKGFEDRVLASSPSTSQLHMIGVDPSALATDDKHRMLLKDLSRRFRLSKERLQQIDMTEDMTLLNRMILDKMGKIRLTDVLLPVKEDLLVKVHFCSAVAEYEAMPEGKCKRTKAKKIIKIFVHKDSMFHLHGIPTQ